MAESALVLENYKYLTVHYAYLSLAAGP
jgi:hypothetical protein